MAQAGKGWSEESDKRSSPARQGQARLVEVAAQGFRRRRRPCSSASSPISQTFIEQQPQARRPRRAARRGSHARPRETAGRRGALPRAKSCKRIEGKQSAATIVHSVLTRPWANYLVLTLLRQGEDSNEWRQRAAFRRRIRLERAAEDQRCRAHAPAGHCCRSWKKRCATAWRPLRTTTTTSSS